MVIVEIVVDVLVAVYLIVMSVVDIRKKEILLWPGILCLGLVGTTRLVAGIHPVGIGLGVGIGVMLYGVSRITRGGIGGADALVYAVTGATIGFTRNLELLLISLILAALVGGLLLLIRKAGLKTRMPFVPFTLVSYGLVLLM